MIGPAGCFAAPKEAHEEVHDSYVQCTRCRNKHRHSDRFETEEDKHGMRTLACPRCGGYNYYQLDSNGKQVRRLS